MLPLFLFALEEKNQNLFEGNTMSEVLFSLSQITSDFQCNANDYICTQMPQKIINICLKSGLQDEGIYGLRVLGNLVAGEIDITHVNLK